MEQAHRYLLITYSISLMEMMQTHGCALSLLVKPISLSFTHTHTHTYSEEVERDRKVKLYCSEASAWVNSSQVFKLAPFTAYTSHRHTIMAMEHAMFE